MKYAVGIDIGTSACKTAFFDAAGTVAVSAVSAYPLRHPHPGWAEQDPRDFYAAVCATLKECFARSGIDPRDVCGVGVDGQSWSAIALDREGNVLAPDPIWMDTRASAICASLPEELKADAFALDGNPLTANYVTGKILWMSKNTPEILDKTYKILQSEGYINYRLTGRMTMNVSEGYGWHCFDIAKLCWNYDMAERLGIPARILPELFACHDIIGAVSDTAAGETGLAAGTPVVAGGVDAASATLGAGVLNPGETQEQGGQSGGMSICVDGPKSDPRLILCPHVVPGLWLLQGGTTGGGGVIRWAEREFGRYEALEAPQRGMSVPALFDVEAAKAPAGSDGLIFLPYMAGERSPLWDPDAKGVFYGMDFSKTRAHFLRAAMEGVGYSLLHNLDAAKEAGAEITLLRSNGGAANSRFWTQIKADMTGLPITVGESDNATNLGTAMLAGVATGLWPDFAAAVRETIHEKRRHEPNPENMAVYEKNYRKYLEIYKSLYQVMHS